MIISLIIITYNRTKDLKECLDTVLLQSRLPQEIIIVDNDKSGGSQNLIAASQNRFAENNVKIIYLKNNVQNSLTYARNLGVKYSVGDIIIFLDDDVLLEKDYFKELLKTYENHPQALGVQGYLIGSDKISFFRNIIYKLFFLYHLENNKCRALPSVSATYPFPSNNLISCQWLSGANHSYRRKILEEYSYDEKLIKYSEGEDLDFSHRVFLKYPGTLYLTPHSKLIHKTSPGGRTLGPELIKMREIYGLYIFYKTFYHKLTRNTLIYIWSRFGKIAINIIVSIYKLTFTPLRENYHLIGAYLYCLKHLQEIKNGDLDFFNKTFE